MTFHRSRPLLTTDQLIHWRQRAISCFQIVLQIMGLLPAPSVLTACWRFSVCLVLYNSFYLSDMDFASRPLRTPKYNCKTFRDGMNQERKRPMTIG
ncbi:hypothetical protein J6590_017512 [Homalodisca vitripennis]|nr:hypothetical protein J6590_017512 [Homalodisca vitripennis]